MQSRKLSLIESLTNVAVGFALSLISQLVIFGAYGVNLPLEQNIAITCWFTLISIIRSYTLRRAFNRVRERKPEPAEQYTRFDPPPVNSNPPPRYPRPPAPPAPPEPRFITAYGRSLSTEEVRQLRAAASMRGPSL